ncbi:MAG: HlyD family secretion protein [Bdellovibrio sp.]|nr:MAG: HlyD family secretion protein [Bdellovibrio sp.]
MSRKILTLSLLGAGILIFAGFFMWDHLKYVTTDNAQVEAHVVLLASKVGGYVTQVRVTEGQKVNRGDVLVEIDERDYQNTLKQMQSELTSIAARKKDADRNLKRLSELYAKSAISQQQFDTASTSALEVKAKYEGLEAQVAQARLNLENTKITAPTNGHVAKKSVEPGQLASPGVPLLGFVSDEERWITANFKETEIANVKLGNRVEISVDALPSKSYAGQVESVSSATGATFTLLPPDNATGNFTKVVQRVPVKIKFGQLTAQDIDDLRAGLSTVVKVVK